MRVSKKIFSVMLILLCTTIVGTSPIKTNPTLTTLKWESSEILTDYEGSLPSYTNPLTKLEYYSREYNTTQTIEIYELKSTHKYELFQIGINSFLVLGSPIEWDTFYKSSSIEWNLYDNN